VLPFSSLPGWTEWSALARRVFKTQVKEDSLKKVTTLLGFLVLILTSCQKSQPPVAEVKKSPDQPAPTSRPQPKTSSTSPPAVAELQEAISRVYKDAVIVDEKRSDAVVGDFNGDNAEDIAIVVTPNNRTLSDLNSEYANWILEDPVSVGEFIRVRGVRGSEKQPPRAVVRSGDTLLAVVHGHQQGGWRNSQATQTYLLRNAVGDTLQLQHRRLLLDEAADNQSLPPLLGDVIRETLANKDGFLYWTGAKYAWHHLN
jgi:hypothetical protein